MIYVNKSDFARYCSVHPRFQKAFDAITFEEAIAAPKEIYYPKKLARDTAARDEFQKEKGRGSILTETYILDIIRQGWKNDDERLQRVVLG